MNLKKLKEKPLSKNKDISMADIKLRKKILEDDLELLEDNFEDRISNVQKKILGPLQPIEFIKNNPFKAVGTAVILGMAIGLLGKNKSSENESSKNNGTPLSNAHKEKLFDLLFSEVKRVTARKAATYLSDLIDEKISSRERE